MTQLSKADSEVAVTALHSREAIQPWHSAHALSETRLVPITGKPAQNHCIVVYQGGKGFTGISAGFVPYVQSHASARQIATLTRPFRCETVQFSEGKKNKK